MLRVCTSERILYRMMISQEHLAAFGKERKCYVPALERRLGIFAGTGR